MKSLKNHVQKNRSHQEMTCRTIFCLMSFLMEKMQLKKKRKEEDDIEKYLDKEYKAKIDQYCILLEDEKPQKKKKKPKEKKVEEKLPSMKMVEIKSIQQQLQQQKDKPSEKAPIKVDDSMFGKNESNVNKFREMFDTDNKNQNPELERGQDTRRFKRVKSDIFIKIQALKMLRRKDQREKGKMRRE